MKRKFTLVFLVWLLPSLSFALAGQGVPNNVRVFACDGNPRIIVNFEGATESIWYPANNGQLSDMFLSMALTAKATSSVMWYFGGDDPATTYCLNNPARSVYVWDIK